MRQTRKQRGGEVVTIAAATVDELIRKIRDEDPGRVSIMRKTGYKMVGEVVNFDIDEFAQCLESSTPLLLTIGDKNTGRQTQFMFTINSDNVNEFSFDTVGLSKAKQALMNARMAEYAKERKAYENAVAANINKLAATGAFKPNIVNGKMKCPRCGAVEGGTSRYIAHDFGCPFKGLGPIISQTQGGSKRYVAKSSTIRKRKNRSSSKKMFV